MFKYLWIVMLVLLVGGFIGYTAVCMCRSLMDAIEYCNKKYKKEDISTFEIIEQAWSDFTCYNDVLCWVWVCILIVIAVVLFVTSLACFLPEPPAE